MGGIYIVHRSDGGSGVIIYITSFIKIGSAIQKLLGMGYTDSMEIA
jgi:hypothetical protein